MISDNIIPDSLYVFSNDPDSKTLVYFVVVSSEIMYDQTRDMIFKKCFKVKVFNNKSLWAPASADGTNLVSFTSFVDRKSELLYTGYSKNPFLILAMSKV